MLRVVFAFLICLLAWPATAADPLGVGPAPAWVRPLTVSAPPIGADGGPFRILLQDRQLNFTPQGDSEYAAQVIQVRTPQGLAALGTLSMVWNPDTDTVVVHHVRILRDGRFFLIAARQRKRAALRPPSSSTSRRSVRAGDGAGAAAPDVDRDEQEQRDQRDDASDAAA
eukprot:gene65247-89262_t